MSTTTIDFETDAENLSHEELRSNWDELYERLEHGPDPGDDDRERFWDRRRELWQEMKRRTDAEPPACPGCGGQSWSQTVGGPKRCTQCDYHPGADEMDLIEAVDEYWRTVKAGSQEADAA